MRFKKVKLGYGIVIDNLYLEIFLFDLFCGGIN